MIPKYQFDPLLASLERIATALETLAKAADGQKKPDTPAEVVAEKLGCGLKMGNFTRWPSLKHSGYEVSCDVCHHKIAEGQLFTCPNL